MLNYLSVHDFVWINSTVTPFFDERNLLRKFLFVDTNITESKNMENQIMASLKEKDSGILVNAASCSGFSSIDGCAVTRT